MKLNLNDRNKLKSSLISMIVAFTLIFTFTVSIQAEDVDGLGEIEEYLRSLDADAHVYSVLASLEAYEGDEIAVDTIKSLIDSLVEDELDLEQFYTAINNIVRAQNSGITAEELESISNNLDLEENYGLVVSQFANELSVFASDDENDGEAVKEMAQDLAELAGSNEVTESEDVTEFVKVKKAEAEMRKQEAAEMSEDASDSTNEAKETAEDASQKAEEAKETAEEAKNNAENKGNTDDNPGNNSNPNN